MILAVFFLFASLSGFLCKDSRPFIANELNLHCMNLTAHADERNLEVTLKSGSLVFVNFTLDEQVDPSGRDPRIVDFTTDTAGKSGSSSVTRAALRINFRSFNATHLEVVVMSMDEDASTKGVVKNAWIERSSTYERISMNILVANDPHNEFKIKLLSQGGQGQAFVPIWNYDHFIPPGFYYQTVGSIHFGQFTELSAEVCSVPNDGCEAICVKCPPGTQTASTEMEPARGGRNGTHACLTCAEGMYSEKEGSAECSLCPAGFHVNRDRDFGADECIPCPESQVSTAGSKQCALCASGSRVNATTCTCDPGTRRVTAVMCTKCLTGRFAARPNMDHCVKCAGQVEDAGRACTCSNGQPSGRDGSCPGLECQPGFYKNEKGFCESCPAGSYGSTGTECSPCERGQYQGQPGQTSCLPCPAGTYLATVAGVFCVPCPSGSYQDEKGQSKCKPCLSGVVVDNVCIQTAYSCEAHKEKLPNVGDISWRAGSPGETTTEECPHGGQASRLCTDMRYWAPSNVAGCRSEVSETVDQAIEKAAVEGEEGVSNLSDFVSETVALFAPSDLERVTSAVVRSGIRSTATAESVVKVAVGMAGYNGQLQHAVPASTKERLVSLLEGGLSYLVRGNVTAVDQWSSSDVTLSISQHEKNLPNDQQVSIPQEGVFSTIVYHNSKLFPTPEDTLSSEILGVNHYGGEAVTSVHLTIALGHHSRAECRWYNRESGKWSTMGCYITAKSDSTMLCHCNHLTSFAAFTSLSEIPEEHRRAQSILSTFLFVTSIVLCLITMALYLPIRSLRNKAIIKIEMMELLSLVLANTTFLLLSRLHHQSALCEGMVFALHYLYLVTIAWSFVAALTFYTQIVRAIHSYGQTTSDWAFLRYCLGCWTLPIIPPLTSLLYSRSHPQTHPYVADLGGEFGCWMDPEWKTYAFVLPILCVVGVNTFLAIRVILVMLHTGQKKKDTTANKRHVKSIVCLLTLFGSSFLLAIFTYGPQAVVFQYLFILLTCSQGIVIFVLFVPLRPEVHGEWRDFLSRSSVLGRRTSSPLSAPRTSEHSLSLAKSNTGGRLFPQRDTDQKLNTLQE